jgi:hypothetical protein
LRTTFLGAGSGFAGRAFESPPPRPPLRPLLLRPRGLRDLRRPGLAWPEPLSAAPSLLALVRDSSASRVAFSAAGGLVSERSVADQRAADLRTLACSAGEASAAGVSLAVGFLAAFLRAGFFVAVDLGASGFSEAVLRGAVTAGPMLCDFVDAVFSAK